MDVAQAVQARRSIRAFRPDPVPQEVLREILELACRAPSWENTQPWEFAVVGGEKLGGLRRALTEASSLPGEPAPDLPYPRFTEPYLARRRHLGMTVFEAKGIAREDTEKRRQWGLTGVRLFEAPNAIFLFMDRSLDSGWSLIDTGLVTMAIAALAPKYGLGTCVQAAPARYPQVVRRVLGVPENKKLILAIAIGYPDPVEPVNQLHTPREPLDKMTSWHLG